MADNISTGVQRRREQNRLAQRRFRERHGQRKTTEQRQRISSLGSESRGQGGRPSGATASRSLDLQSSSITGSPSGAEDRSTGGPSEDVFVDYSFSYGGMDMLHTPGQDPTVLDSSSSMQQILKRFVYNEDGAQSLLPLEGPRSTESIVCGPADKGASSFGVSPLHMAVQNGHTKIVRLLLEHDADCNVKDTYGRTPLMHATIKDYEDILDLLLSHGAGIQYVDKYDRSALHLAVLHRRDRLLKKLLDHCGNVNILVDSYNKEGKTALHIAIEAGFEAGVELLLNSGANAQCMARHDEATIDGFWETSKGDVWATPKQQ